VIKLADIRAAAEASKFVYKNHLAGTKIPNTNFKITKIFFETFSPRDNVGIKAIMADDGNTRMVAYRGTKG